jgi:RimJ/RimL family protein N-acetyltransferase
MAHSEFLLEFRDVHAREISRWATSLEEVRRWAGSDTGWPVDVSVYQLWHADPDVKPYVLCDGDALVGYGEVWIDESEHEVELGRIIVEPASRGRGVGRQFVRLLLERASLSGFPDAFVRVVPDNHVAIACYRSAGFSLVPESMREQYNRGQPVDYVWMHHPLADRGSGASGA